MSNQTNVPKWYWIASFAGLAWSIVGLVQFIQSQISTRESLLQMGMSPAQVDVLSTYPLWMTLGFAVGTFAAFFGNVALLWRKKFATPLFLASLMGYVLLYVGDITEGIFAALGPSQVVILSTVVIIAALQLWMARHFARTGALR